MIQSLFDIYPSYYRDNGYEDYYENHCNNVKEIIAYGQSKEKKYTNYTTAFIPVLAQISPEGDGENKNVYENRRNKE